jgi:hypothetical protein
MIFYQPSKGAAVRRRSTFEYAENVSWPNKEDGTFIAIVLVVHRMCE